MTDVRTEVVKTLKDYTEFIEDLRTENDGSFWYRGSRESKYSLIPSLYRRYDIPSAAEFLDLEQKLLTRFKQRSIPYQTRPITDDLDYLFLMQHYGVPTRLLDWTENPYIALYFALEKYVQNSQDAAVWIIDPATWNRKSLEHMSFDSGVLSANDDRASGYAPSADLHLMNNLPIAIYGAYNSSRIVAQRGAFTIFGKDYQPMEKMYKTTPFPQGSLIKVILPSDCLESLHESIIRVGFTSSVVYPDLEGLARELKWDFGFRE